MADGSRHSLLKVVEAVYGQTPTNPALDTVRITGTTLGLAKDSLQSDEIRSDRQIADFRLGANNVLGDVNFELSYGSFDELLQGVLLSQDWAAGTPVAGTQQIKSGVNRKSFTFVRYFSDIAAVDKPYHIYRGCEINSMSLTISSNAMVVGTFSVIGQSQEAVPEIADAAVFDTPTVNPPTSNPPLDSFTGELKEAGNTIAVITEISLSLANGIAPRFVVGSKDTIEPSLGRSTLTGSITAYFEDSLLVDKFINETPSSLEFTLPDGLGNEQKFIIPRIIYTGGQPDLAGEGPVTLNMPFQAILDPTAQTNLLIERTPV